MKGDFSRLPAPRGPYSGVWMQQGRVQLDQDWNEQLVLDAERTRSALRDLVGSGGAPASDPGFRVRARGGIHFSGDTELHAEVEPAFTGVELTVEVRVLLGEWECGGVLVQVEDWFVLAVDDDGRLSFRGFGGGAAVTSPEALATGEAMLVSAAYDGRTAVLHLDGRPVARATLGDLVPPPCARLSIGASRGEDGAAENGFGGTLDEVRLWSHARTPTQVRDYVARTLTGAEAGLAHYYPVDEGAGRTAHDRAGGRHARAPHPPRWNPQSVVLGSGRMYVDGIPCVVPGEVPLEKQADLPDTPALRPGRHLVYLDVWERYVDAVEDPAIREIALGGLDTTGRTRTVWQARSLPLAPDEDWSEALLRVQRARLRAVLSARRNPPDSPAPGNRLYRVEVHGSGGLYGWPRLPGDAEGAAHVTAVESTDGGGGTLTLQPGAPGMDALLPGARVEIFTRATDAAEQPGALAHVTAVDPARHQVTVDRLPAGLTVPGDSWVRVRAVATFLWSEDNAWRAWAVHTLDTKTGRAVLEDAGPEGVPLVPGDLVELTGEETVLLSRPGLLLTVRHVDPHAETVTLEPVVSWPAHPPAGRMVLRRWSRPGGSGPADATPARAHQWMKLSDGMEARFEGTAFRTSDYWTLPMRVAAPGGLEWPQAGSRPAALPPQGIEHRYAALATVLVHPHESDPQGHRIQVEDHRTLFEPLTSLTREEHRHGHHHHHDHHHHHHHDEEVDVTVREGDTTVEVDVRERGGDDEVDVWVDGPGAGVHVQTREADDGGEDVRITVGDDHHHHHHHHDGEGEGDDPGELWGWGDIEAAERGEDAGGTSVEVDVHSHGHDDGVEVDVRPDGHGGEIVEVDVREHGHHGRHGHHDDDVRVVVHTAPAVPAGFWIFGETPLAPEGYAGTGARMTIPEAAPAWHPRAPLPAARARVRCVSLDGILYAFAEGTRDVLRYEPDADVWHQETLLPESWRAYALAELDGRIHLVGGLDGRSRAVDWHRTYEPRTGRWGTRAVLGERRHDMGAASTGGLLYVAGGQRPLLSMTTAAVDAYDPVADEWTRCRRMHHARANPGVAAVRGRIYAVGGRLPGLGSGRPSGHVESYDPATGRWKELEHVPTPRLDAALAELDGVLYLAGGDAGAGPTGLTQRFVPGFGWGGGPEMERERSGLGLAAFSGRIFAVGGGTDAGATHSVEACRLYYDLHGFRKE